MTRIEIEQLVSQLLLEQKRLRSFSLELPPDKLLLLKRLLYRLGLNRMSRKQPKRVSSWDEGLGWWMSPSGKIYSVNDDPYMHHRIWIEQNNEHPELNAPYTEYDEDGNMTSEYDPMEYAYGKGWVRLAGRKGTLYAESRENIDRHQRKELVDHALMNGFKDIQHTNDGSNLKQIWSKDNLEQYSRKLPLRYAKVDGDVEAHPLIQSERMWEAIRDFYPNQVK